MDIDTNEQTLFIKKHYSNILIHRKSTLKEMKLILSILVSIIVILFVLSLPNFYLYDYLTIPKILLCIAIIIAIFEVFLPRMLLSIKGVKSAENIYTEKYITKVMNNPETNEYDLFEELNEVYNDGIYTNKNITKSIDELAKFKGTLIETENKDLN